jgi:hypothetical protein
MFGSASRVNFWRASVARQLIDLARDKIGPVAAFKIAIVVHLL